MEIQIDPHTLERSEERGTNEKEIRDVIKQVLLLLPSMGVQVKRRSTILNKSAITNIMNKGELKYSILLKAIK